MKYQLKRTKPFSRGEVWYVSHLPGDGGMDWGYDSSPAKALAVGAYWKRRFVSDMRAIGTAWSTTEVSA